MERIGVDLNNAQIAVLDAMARRQGLSGTEVLRRLIHQTINESPADTRADRAAIEESFGAINNDLADDLTTERGLDERAAHLNRIRAL